MLGDLQKVSRGSVALIDDGSRLRPEPIDLGYGRRLTPLWDVEIHLLTLTPAQRTLHSWMAACRASAAAEVAGDRIG
jgi:hypothetical protein